MGENSGIEWTDHTFNPWIGCTRVSPACDHCYAESYAKRFGKAEWGAGKPRQLTSESNWNLPLKWNRQAMADGVRRRVFCASLADVFDNEVDPAWRDRLWELIRATPHLDWLLLTKRIGNVAKMLPQDWGNGWENVWLGITVANQQEADRDIPKLLTTPARLRFLSMEPLLGPVDLAQSHAIYSRDYCTSSISPAASRSVDWVIVGGESGHDARPMHPDWARSLRDQCVAAGVPYLFKQWGEYGTCYTIGNEPVFKQFPCFQTWVNKAQTWVRGGICLDAKGRECRIGRDMQRAHDEGAFPVTIMHRVGKKAAGRLLDGREWNEVPSLPSWKEAA